MSKQASVRHGTLALMILKSLDVIGPLHGYGMARRIEQQEACDWEQAAAILARFLSPAGESL